MSAKIRTFVVNDLGLYLTRDWWAWSGILLGLLFAGVL